MQAPAPDASRIPEDDILGATIVLITCWYKRQEVVRVGFWVNNTYNDEIPEGEEVPRPIDLTKVTRNVLADKPRVTRFNVEDWS
ncbi:hypothetical protein EON67_02065 [archaeon]|nr:MAG: hypothetical protein EON67_02065 [archaeon]